ncbi:hypothetical protein Tco_0026677 [Tanacetum coccineum]
MNQSLARIPYLVLTHFWPHVSLSLAPYLIPNHNLQPPTPAQIYVKTATWQPLIEPRHVGVRTHDLDLSGLRVSPLPIELKHSSIMIGGRTSRGSGRTRGRTGDQGKGGIDEQGGQVCGQGNEVNDGVDGVPDFSTIIAQQLQNLLPTILA